MAEDGIRYLNSSHQRATNNTENNLKIKYKYENLNLLLNFYDVM